VPKLHASHISTCCVTNLLPIVRRSIISAENGANELHTGNTYDRLPVKKHAITLTNQYCSKTFAFKNMSPSISFFSELEESYICLFLFSREIKIIAPVVLLKRESSGHPQSYVTNLTEHA